MSALRATSKRCEPAGVYVVAGRTCASCNERVTDAKRGIACGACGVQFHRKCLAGRKTCALCQDDLVAAGERDEEQRRREIARTLSRGSAMLWGVTLAIALLPVLAIGGVLAMGWLDRLPRVAIQSGYTLLALFALHRGSSGIGKAIMVLSGFQGALVAFLAFAFVDSHAALAWTAVAVGLAYVVLAMVMFFSTELWRYLDHLRAQRDGSGRSD